MTEKKRVTNKKFAQENEEFKNYCTEAGVQATTRQASKFKNKKGKVYKYVKNMV